MGLNDILKKVSGKGPGSSGRDISAQPGNADLDAVEVEELNEITVKLEHERQSREGLGKFLKHPVQVLTERPENILIVCIPLALLFFFGGFIFMVQSYGMNVIFNSTSVDDFLVFAVLIAIVPVALLDLKEQMRVTNLENALPNFFRDLAGMNDSGMTLPTAIHLVAAAEYGTLTPHIRKLDNEMSWGAGFVEALYRFGKGLGTTLADRSVDLIAKASKAGGDVSEVLRAAAKDTFEVVNLQQERANNMLIYVIIVLVAFAVFLFVIAILVSSFLTTMATAGATATASGAKGFGGVIDIFIYKRLFSHAAMLQGFFSGLVAGQMGEGRFVAGLKYSALMLLIAWITFRFFI
ncbi:MAG: type II secretion system F family protein [Methanoregula sp.]|jgi:flagellar protein FlaJ|uniref:type II secretion system F family protein n=1 Tax=Methanoregula sp. TaxID=2052170 RepID=UPI0025E9EB64|nr:type II secretion system F family protein [Methanoregula sp.]MCK9630075.1 type II secretion system F family protein [Methanoregula sp.]